MSQPGPPPPPPYQEPQKPAPNGVVPGPPAYGQSVQGQPVYGQPVYGHPAAPATVSPFAIVSLVSGAVSGLMLLSGIFPLNFLGALGAAAAVVFGHVSLVTIARRRPTQSGRGLGIAGLVLGYLGIGSIVLWIAFAVFVVLGLAASSW
jgi:hypothetical protein